MKKDSMGESSLSSGAEGLSRQDLFSMFFEEAMLITRDRESALRLAQEAVRDFIRRHRLGSARKEQD